MKLLERPSSNEWCGYVTSQLEILVVYHSHGFDGVGEDGGFRSGYYSKKKGKCQ